MLRLPMTRRRPRHHHHMVAPPSHRLRRRTLGPSGRMRRPRTRTRPPGRLTLVPAATPCLATGLSCRHGGRRWTQCCDGRSPRMATISPPRSPVALALRCGCDCPWRRPVPACAETPLLSGRNSSRRCARQNLSPMAARARLPRGRRGIVLPRGAGAEATRGQWSTSPSASLPGAATRRSPPAQALLMWRRAPAPALRRSHGRPAGGAPSWRASSRPCAPLSKTNLSRSAGSGKGASKPARRRPRRRRDRWVTRQGPPSPRPRSHWRLPGRSSPPRLLQLRPWCATGRRPLRAALALPRRSSSARMLRPRPRRRSATAQRSSGSGASSRSRAARRSAKDCEQNSSK
mmetsp:Transcript_29474/g.64456  ORF Transcript_29474/g.64456 Transcript_29474/m.64456 type:complete len:346 (-) Transcript_29474:688-1725(-)